MTVFGTVIVDKDYMLIVIQNPSEWLVLVLVLFAARRVLCFNND